MASKSAQMRWSANPNMLFPVCDILNVGADSIMGVRCMPPIEPDVRGPSGSSQLLHFLLLSSN